MPWWLSLLGRRQGSGDDPVARRAVRKDDPGGGGSGADPDPSGDDPGKDFGNENDIHDVKHDYGGDRLECREDERGLRSTCDHSGASLEDRACIDAGRSDYARGLNDARASEVDGFLEGLQDGDNYDWLEGSAADPDEGLTDLAQPGERATPWAELDAIVDALLDAKEFVVDFVGGGADLVEMWQAMKDADTKRADPYFHCVANCRAASRGPGGEYAARTLSNLREEVQSVTNVMGGMTFEDSIVDCDSDQRANDTGRQAGVSGVRCYDACKQYEPKWK